MKFLKKKQKTQNFHVPKSKNHKKKKKERNLNILKNVN